MALRKIVNCKPQGIPLNLKDPETGKEAIKMLPATHYVRRGDPVNWYKHEGVLLVDEAELSPHVTKLQDQGYLEVREA